MHTLSNSERLKEQQTKKKTKKNKQKKTNCNSGVPIVDQGLTNLTSIHEDTGSYPGISQ